MAAPLICPSCDTPLALFTPREAESHVNACLDLLSAPSSPRARDKPTCAVCSRDLSALTSAARAEHANRCADTLLPLPPLVSAAHRARPPKPPAASASREARRDVGDGRVVHLLTMLGLQRYAPKFANEEIDLVALRLLSEDDLAALAIPEAARRRIAEAMHSVPILAQLQRVARQSQGAVHASAQTSRIAGEHRAAQAGREAGDGTDVVADVVRTQRFAESRLGAVDGRVHARALLDDQSDDDIYIPTARARVSPPQPPVSGRDAPTSPSRRSHEALERAPDYALSEPQDRDHDAGGHSSASSSSSFASDLGDVVDGSRGKSQIGIEGKLRKWRRRQLAKERARHVRQVAHIEDRYMDAVRRAPSELVEGDGPITAEAAERRRDVIDLTQDVCAEARPSSAAVCIISSGSMRKGDGENSSSSSLSAIDFCRVEQVASGQMQAASVADSASDDGAHRADAVVPIADAGSDDDEILDLIDSDKENNGVADGMALAEDMVLADDVPEETQSRLKKKRRAGQVKVEDIMKAIKDDGALYDDILMMQCVPFERILECVKKNVTNVSKKTLYEFLVTEGVMFKSTAVPQPQRSQQYLKRLNSDCRDHSD